MSNVGKNEYLKKDEERAKIMAMVLERCPIFKLDFAELKKNRFKMTQTIPIFYKWKLGAPNRKLLFKKHMLEWHVETYLTKRRPVNWQYNELKKLEKMNPNPLNISIDMNYGVSEILKEFKLALSYWYRVRLEKTGRKSTSEVVITKNDLKVYDACMKYRNKNGTTNWEKVKNCLDTDSHENTLRRQYQKVNNKIRQLEQMASERHLK